MYESDARLKVALFRYGVIAPLVCRRVEPAIAKRTRDELLAHFFQYPDGSRRLVPERTLRHWLAKYRKHGFKGLFDEFRSDRGVNKALPEEVLNRAEALREEEPGRSVRTIIQLLKRNETLTIPLSERTVARRLTAIGATKELLKKGAGSYQRWEQEHANDLWQGDTSHGVWLRDPENPNKPKMTKFIVFIDDATRKCTHGEFYFDEQIPSLLDCFGKALLTHGRPCRLLFDNGSIYRSTAMATTCAELGCEISFCRPRSPQGKGKVERFIQTVQESFMTEANHAALQTLDQLNGMFAGWLKNYHESEHSGLNGKSPDTRWSQDLDRISIVSPSELKRSLMLRAKRKIHISTATLQIEGQIFQASQDLAGREVEVRWNVQNMDTVELWQCDVFIETAPAFQIKSFTDRREPHQNDDPAPGIPIESSKSLMSSFLSTEGKNTLENTSKTELLDCGEFVRVFRKSLDRALIQEELDTLGAYFRRVAPIGKDVVQATLVRAMHAKGSDLHLRYYLEQLDQAIRRK